MPQIKLTSPRLLLLVYLVPLLLIVFWPVPVDRGVSGTLESLLSWLHSHGLPEAVGYSEVEFAANVILFVPLGYLLAVWIRRPWTAFTTSAFASIVIEFTQSVLLAQRYSTVLDIVANTAGAMLGVLIASWKGSPHPAPTPDGGPLPATSSSAPVFQPDPEKNLGRRAKRTQRSKSDRIVQSTKFKILSGAAAILAVVGVMVLAGESQSALASAEVEHGGGANGPQRPTVAIIGDDNSAGVGAADNYSGWPVRIAIRMDWNVRNFSYPGTGYATAVDGESALLRCSREHCPSYPEAISDLKRISPSHIIVSGGTNDVWKDPELVRPEIHRLFRELSEVAPTAKVYVVPPFWDNTAPPPELKRLAEMVKAVAQEYEFAVLEIGNPLEGQNSLVVPTGKYPNNEGHRVIADSVETALNAADAK